MDDLFAFIDAHADCYVACLQTLLRQPSVAAHGVGMVETASLVEGMLSA